MRGEDVHGVGPERRAQGVDQHAHPFRVAADGLGRVELEQLLGLDGEPLGHEWHQGALFRFVLFMNGASAAQPGVSTLMTPL